MSWFRKTKLLHRPSEMEGQLHRQLKALNQFSMEHNNELLSVQISLEQRNRQLELITQTVAINFDESDCSMAARLVLARVMSILEADAAELWVVDSQARRLLRVAHQGLLPWDYGEEATLPMGTDLPGLAAATKDPIVSFDLARDHRCLRQDFIDTLFHFLPPYH
jgi:hypothetical protein